MCETKYRDSDSIWSYADRLWPYQSAKSLFIFIYDARLVDKDFLLICAIPVDSSQDKAETLLSTEPLHCACTAVVPHGVSTMNSAVILLRIFLVTLHKAQYHAELLAALTNVLGVFT